MPVDFYKETPQAFGHTTPHFQKSQIHVKRTKIFTTVPPCFLRVLFSPFATAHDLKTSSHKNKSYARTRRGMRMTHDGATSHTTHKTVNLLQANRVNYLHVAIQIIDLIDHTCPISGTLRRRYPANVIQF